MKDGKFQFAVEESAEQVTIALKGVIDEDVDFAQIPTPAKGRYIFNFDGVKGINSCGIREWVRFCEKINPDAKMVYHNCTQIIIEQINMVAGFFRSGSKVERFYAPYFCEKCDEERKILIDANAVKDNEAPEMKCSDCGSTLEFDALEEQYFRFLKMTA